METKNGLYREVLANGLAVIIQEKNSRSATLAAGVRFGTVDHPLCHFIGHMLFKGTGRRTYSDINREAVRGGGSIDDITDLYSTIYFIKTVPEHSYQALGLLCDMLKNSIFPSQEIQYEKAVVEEDLVGRSENPRVILKEIIYKHLHKISAAVIQDKDFLKNFSRKQIFDTYRQFYVPKRLIIVAVGKINKEKILKIVKKYFGSVKNGTLISSSCQKHGIMIDKTKRIVIKKSGLKHTHLMMGFRTPCVASSDYYPLLVLQTILAGNIGSRLFEQLREKRGLLYNITAKLDCSACHGILRFYANFSPKNLRSVENIIKNEFKKLREKPISGEELKTAKLKLVRERRLMSEGTLQHARLLAETEINGKFDDLKHFDFYINKVKAEDVLRVARHYCNLNKAIIAILKPRKARRAV